MRQGQRIAVLIPALDEAAAIAQVVGAVPPWVDDILVVDNGSRDDTAARARDAGARVVHEPRRGYGAACLAGLAALDNADVVVFLDGDGSDVPAEMAGLVDPLVAGEASLVVGSRVLGAREPGALTPVQRFGNALACTLIRMIWRTRYTDLGPFRAIRSDALRNLDMRDAGFGWTVEMQVKAAQQGLPILERPADYRRRIGRSKISGTLRGSVQAGSKILFVIFASAVFGSGHGLKDHGAT